jgi:hypothetical protein
MTMALESIAEELAEGNLLGDRAESTIAVPSTDPAFPGEARARPYPPTTSRFRGWL